MIEKSKIEKRRESKILEAASHNDWDTVSNLLEQPLRNLERKDRKYKLISLNARIVSDTQTSEIIDLVSDNNYNAIEQILLNERNEYLVNALEKLPKEELHIFLQMTLNNKSALQLTKETSYRSHKTVQRHYEKARKFLENELKKYF
ncbi:TPA: sigma-70 family RNA polymerase sigma factor [Streptococcus suis 92-1400]|uniref:hypothetical protein n=1 Tax=Streptococcus TaxID=1301 RepID=UPI00041A8EB3|nr:MULTISPECIES: hypothetical protein [Streptococcus]NQJ87549.1 sigma-70 family RNA polymerase sigma factor [Streptococcus suis]HEM2773628.1 sigma-70 family RNA polymerase sigma factor [Streptococcus suis]HEM3167150.1 sigma-70 family RNA polymerase sigma factor [Streptococcus suis 92-1400]